MCRTISQKKMGAQEVFVVFIRVNYCADWILGFDAQPSVTYFHLMFIYSSQLRG